MENAADFEPFVPEIAQRPSHARDRRELLTSDTAPIIVCPSGMLTGGLSPAYLLELVENYDEARILFTGYQAPGTPGYDLQQAEGDIATVSVSCWPISNDFDETFSSGEKVSSEETDGPSTYTLNVPTDWVNTVSGLSGHAARNTLLQFARKVDANHVALVHGDPENQRPMVTYLDGNVSADIVTRAAMHSPIPVYPSSKNLITVQSEDDVAHSQVEIRPADEADSNHVTDELTQDDTDGNGSSTSSDDNDMDKPLKERIAMLSDRIQAIDEEIAVLRNDNNRSEAELRALIRDELTTILDERGLKDT